MNKYLLIFCLAIGINLTNCFNNKKEFNSNLSEFKKLDFSQYCQRKFSIPKGKGKVFQIDKNKALKTAVDDYAKNEIIEGNDNIVIGETVFFWYIFITKTQYVINKTDGKIISKKNISNDLRDGSLTNNTKISCEEALSISVNDYKKKLISLGYSSGEAMKEIKILKLIPIELEKDWIVIFDYPYYDKYDLNKKEELKTLPNIDLPHYVIDKKNGNPHIYSY